MNYTQLDKRSSLDKIAETIDFNPISSFLLAYDEATKVFRFKALNKVHERSSGLDSKAVMGKTPHEIFAPRLAETLTANYAQCINLRNQISYEEVLLFPTGETWWDTFLSPIFEGDTIIGVLGMAYDKTDAKKTERLLAESLENANRNNTDLKVVSELIASELRAPLQQVDEINDTVRKGFKDLGDNKLQLLETGKELVTQSIKQIDLAISSVKQIDNSPLEASQVDIGKWCMDIIALLDPDKQYDFFYPQVTITCEKFLLDIALRNLIENACQFAKSSISVDLLQVSADEIIFTVKDDSAGFDQQVPRFLKEKAAPANGRTTSSLSSSKKLIEARGGKLWVNDVLANQTGGSVSFRLSGQMIEPNKKYMFMRTA